VPPSSSAVLIAPRIVRERELGPAVLSSRGDWI
jgi:hypothetical protein